MAEAHQAVIFQQTLKNQKVYKSELNAAAGAFSKAWKSNISRLINRFYNGIYPARPGSWPTISAAIFVSNALGYDLSFGLTPRIESLIMENTGLDRTRSHLLGAISFSCILWCSGAIIRRHSLLFLYNYQQWIYEVYSGMSWKTKIWAFFVKLFGGNSPGLYSNQNCLPYLPVPSIQDTLKRYIRSVQPFMSKNELDHTINLANNFEKNESRRLQFYLKLKYYWSTNYVSDWWEEYIYLYGRSPLMLNSNIYGMDAVMNPATTLQAARAGSVVDVCVKYMKKLAREEIEPTIINKMIPLCSHQYERMFNTTRIPGVQKDTLRHFCDVGKHIVALHKGRFFQVPLIDKGKWLDARELERIFQTIIDDQSNPIDGEELIPYLTAGERTHWAETREKYFGTGINRISLDVIESAAFFLCLDDHDLILDTSNQVDLNNFARMALHGLGNNRWFDKSFNIIVGKNARIGFNAEHSWSDAPIMGNLWEEVLMETQEYDMKGHRRGRATSVIPKAVRLQWEISDKLLEAISVSKGVAHKLIEDTDHHVLVHDAFGKGLVRAQKTSPDAFIQLALQLAYFRNQKEFCLTYEASMTRLFRDGRTETVRSCTNESVDFVQCMENKKSTKSERLEALRKACNYHQNLYRDAMTGKGVDRHLFCLYVVSKYLKIESEFLASAIKIPWKLSTSQTPHGQTERAQFLCNQADLISIGGGFGPVSDDGYGVSYIVAGDHTIFFHISSKESCKKTKSRDFAKDICEAMNAMKQLFD